MRPRSRAALMAACAAVASLLVGCAALSPQVFSPEMDPDPPPPVRLDEAGAPMPAVASDGKAVPASAPSPAASTGGMSAAIENARLLQRRYVAAAQSLSKGNAAIGASLIGVGTAGGINAVSHPVSRDIAGLAMALGGLFTYGNTMLPPARAKAYVAGVQALECAIEAAKALDVPTLQRDASTARLYQARLDRDIQQLQAWQQPKRKTVTSGGPAPECARPPVGCGTAVTSSDADRERQRRLCEQFDTRRSQRCAPSSSSVLETPAHPDVLSQLNWATDVRRSMAASLLAAARLQPQVDLAGDALTGRTRAIETAVFTEVAKTEPDLNAIKTAASGILDAGNVFIPQTKAPAATQGPAGTSLSSNAPVTKAAAGIQERPLALDDVADDIAWAAAASDRLQATLVQLEERARRARALESCSVPGVARPAAGFAPEAPRSSDAPVPLDNGLRLRLAPLLGLDPKADNVARQVDERLQACQARGLISDAGASGTLERSTLTNIVLGLCKA